jgi:stress response protein SCP2
VTSFPLPRGANRELPAHVCRGGHLDVVASWPARAGVDAVDVAVVAVTTDGKVRSDADFVFYNQPTGVAGSVRHLGQVAHADRAFDGVRLHLDAISADITALHVTLSADGGLIGRFEGLTVALHDAAHQLVAQLDLSGAGSEPALIAVEVYRRGDAWKVRCVGQGWDEGLAALARHFGISVEEDQDAGTDTDIGPRTGVSPEPVLPPASAAPSPPPTSMSSDGRHVPEGSPVPFVHPREQSTAADPATRSRWLGRRQRTREEDNAELRAQLARLGGTDAVRLGEEVRQLREELSASQADNAFLREQVQQLGALDAVQLVAETASRRLTLAQQQGHADRRLQTARQELEVVNRDIAAAQGELVLLRETLIVTDEEALLQEAGIYRYSHPLDDAVAYKARLANLKDNIKALVRDGGAVLATTNWQVNGSSRDGAKMVKETSKLMLRAFNAEADNCVRSVRPHTVHTATQRLEKAAETIARLGTMMSIRVSERYLRTRQQEIRLTADHLAKVEEERERLREAREQAREEAKALADFERERAKLRREEEHYLAALEVASTGVASSAAVADLRAKLQNVQEEMVKVDARQANLRAGWVYVISNLGAFGERMVKIGMTRRRDPMDRVRELGDASVPFRFDVHALIQSEDAVGLEGRLHAVFAEQRVNRVNKHREFFYATPADVREALAKIAGSHLLTYKDFAEALEWRQSGEHQTLTTPRAR